jgi:hypothetical protein
MRPAPPTWIVRAIINLRRMLQRLADAIVPPHVLVLERAAGVAYTSALAELATGGYAELLAAGPLTAQEVAARTGANPDATFRFLHMFASIGFLVMHEDGRFATNRVLDALRIDHPMQARAFVEYFASRSNIAAWLDLRGTLVTGKNAFSRIHGTSIWDWFDAHPDERETFANAMMGLTRADAPFVAAAYPFVEVSTVCDVGGGRGTLLSEVLLRHGHLQGVLVEGAGVLASARRLFAERKLADRVRLEAGNFFQVVPPGADLYMMKNILHDWDDVASLKILGVVRRAMQPGQRILIIEALLDRSGPDPLACPSDMQMMLVCVDGRERSLDELRRLLHESGFAPARAFELPTIGLIEGIAR